MEVMSEDRDDKGHDSPHTGESSEPLGPMTPDDETPAGDTPEAHDELSPLDLPPDHPGRREAEREAGGIDGTTEGNR
jgi:hypothetical protein